MWKGEGVERATCFYVMGFGRSAGGCEGGGARGQR